MKYYEIIYVVLLLSLVLVKSYINMDGYLIHDSYFYLSHANNLALDRLFQFCHNSGDVTFFSTWPIGYPIFISLVSNIANINVFWASKILNILFALLILVLLKNQFPKKWFLMTCFIFSGVFFKLMVLSLSEVGFIAFGFSLIYIIKNNPNYFLIVFLSFSLFLFRYLGIFILLFLLISYFYYKNRVFIFAFFTVLVLIAMYFSLLYFNVGFVSGADRVGTNLNRLYIIKEIFISFISLLSFYEYLNITGSSSKYLYFLGIFPYAYIILIFISYVGKSNLIELFKKTDYIYFIFGFSYFISYFFLIFAFNLLHQGESISSRFLFPAFIYFIVYLLSIVNLEKFKFSKYFIILIAFTSIFFNGIYKSYVEYKQFNGLNYVDNVYNIKFEISPNSGKKSHLLYLEKASCFE